MVLQMQTYGRVKQGLFFLLHKFNSFVLDTTYFFFLSETTLVEQIVYHIT